MEKQIKVCCVVSTDLTLKFMLFNQLKFLQSQGYQVYAVSSSGKWVGDIEKEGIPVKIIPFKRKISPFADVVLFFRLYNYFKKEKFDVIHVHTLKPEFYGQLAAKFSGTPVILNTLHGFDFREDESLAKKNLFLLLERTAATCSTAIFTIAHHIIDRAKKEKIGSDKLVYLGRDIDTHRFDLTKYSPEFVAKKKQELGIDSEKKDIGIVARLVIEKGYLELFEAFKKVLERFPNTILLVIGQEEPEKKDGFTKDIAKKYSIENKVVFLGERTDTEELYPVMDIFVLPTHREGLGAAILEASAMERPVIVSNTGGCPEAVDDGITGILIPVKNIEKLTKALILLLQNPTKAKAMGLEGRKKIIREFSNEVVFERLGKTYGNLIKTHVARNY